MNLFPFAVMIVACSAARLEHLEKQKSAYLPPGQDFGIKSSADDSSRDNTNTVGVTDDGHHNGSGSNKESSLNQLPDTEPSSSSADAEFAGYFYGPGIAGNGNNQKPTQLNQSQFGEQGTNRYSNQPSNQKFGQQGTDEYASQATFNQNFGTQGTNRYSSQQTLNQQPGQQGTYQYASNQTPNQSFNQIGSRQQFGQLGTQFSQQDATPQGSNNFGVQHQFQTQQSFANYQNTASQSTQSTSQQAFDEETGYHY